MTRSGWQMKRPLPNKERVEAVLSKAQFWKCSGHQICCVFQDLAPWRFPAEPKPGTPELALRAFAACFRTSSGFGNTHIGADIHDLGSAKWERLKGRKRQLVEDFRRLLQSWSLICKISGLSAAPSQMTRTRRRPRPRRGAKKPRTEKLRADFPFSN